MKRKSSAVLAIAILLFSIFPTGISQEMEDDSVYNSLQLMPDDTNKVKELITQVRQYVRSNPTKSLLYSNEAISLSEQLEYDPGLALALKYHGMAYYFQAEYLETVIYWEQSLNIFEKMGDMNGVSNMLNNIGAVYFNLGDNLKAIEYYLPSLEAAEKIGDSLRIVTALINIGGIYSTKEESEKALKYYWKALPLANSIGDLNAIGTSAVNLGGIYLNLKEYDSALYYFDSSLVAYRQIPDGNSPYALSQIGRTYAEKKNYQRALQYQQQAYETARERNAKLEMVQTLIGMADTYSRMDNNEAALEILKQARGLAEDMQANNELESVYDALANNYVIQSDYKEAYSYKVLLEQVREQLYNAEKDKSLERQQFTFDMVKKESEITLLIKDNELQALEMERQRVVKYAFQGGLILIFIIAFVLYRNYRIKVKSNKKLGAQKLQIENLLLNILPAKVAKELQVYGFATPRYYENVSVLFTDFKGFSRIAEGLTPNELVSELNEFFIAFDGIVEKYGLEKIKTIGDAYMCAGGIPTENDIHPLNTVKAGLEMQTFMEDKNKERVEAGKPPWGLRVGVHTGPLVAGVVGRKKYAYDIWGSTVNISSRMESNGESGKLNISSVTFELIKDHYTCTYRGKIHAKNIGDIDMYFVDKAIDDSEK